MSVGEIALGMFLGNLAFALVAWFVMGMVAQSNSAANDARAAHERLEALQGR